VCALVGHRYRQAAIAINAIDAEDILSDDDAAVAGRRFSYEFAGAIELEPSILGKCLAREVLAPGLDGPIILRIAHVARRKLQSFQNVRGHGEWLWLDKDDLIPVLSQTAFEVNSKYFLKDAHDAIGGDRIPAGGWKREKNEPVSIRSYRI
jgi:hypothetical protein